MNYFQGLRPATDKESKASLQFAGPGAGKYSLIHDNEVPEHYWGEEQDCIDSKLS
jgi:hypothetical protein